MEDELSCVTGLSTGAGLSTDAGCFLGMSGEPGGLAPNTTCTEGQPTSGMEKYQKSHHARQERMSRTTLQSHPKQADTKVQM